MMSRPPLSKRMASSTTATLHKDRKATMFDNKQKPVYTGKSSPRKDLENQQVRIQTTTSNH